MEYKSFMEALKGNQHKLDKNKNGKLDAHDFKLLRKEETEELDEAMSPQQKADFDRMMAGAMSRAAYNAKWKKRLKSDSKVIYGKNVKEEVELDEADIQARADYKLDKSGRKYHKQIHFKDGSNDEANEKNEVREATQYGLPSHSHAHVMKKIKSGDWEATHDIKAGRHLEIIDHSKGGKRKTIHVKEEFNVNEEMTDTQKSERERLVKGMKKNLAGFKAKYGERAKEVMYATATKQAMKEEAESLEEESGQHKVVVTVSDPNHPAVSQRKEQIMKRVIVKADHKEGAVAKAKEFYKKKGYKVHDAEYHSPQPKSTMKTEETSLEESMTDSWKKVQSMDKGSVTGGKDQVKKRLAYLNAVHDHHKKFGNDTKKVKSEIEAINRSRIAEDLEEATLVTKEGPKSLRPGTLRNHTIVKSYAHSSGETAHVVKQPNGFHGVIVTNKDKTSIVGSTHRNHDEKSAHEVAKHYAKHKTVGMKSGSWYHGSLDSIHSIKEESELEEGYVVRYHNPKSEKHGSEKHFDSQESAQKHAERGNSVDKIGGKYTVHKTNEKGHDIKEQAELEEGIKTVYHKFMAKRAGKKADDAYDMGDEKEFQKQVDKSEYHRVKAGGKPTRINKNPDAKFLTTREEVELDESVKIIDRDSDLDQEHFKLSVNGKPVHFVHHNYEGGHATDSKQDIHYQVKNQLKHLSDTDKKKVTDTVHASYRMKEEFELDEAVESGNKGYGYHGQHESDVADKKYSAMHAKVKKVAGEAGHLRDAKKPNVMVKHYLDSRHGRHLAGNEHDHEYIKKDFGKFKKSYKESDFAKESVGFDEEGNLMAEKLTYAQFMERLLEYTPGPGGVTRVQGRSYGAQYHDPEGDDDADDKPKKKAEPAVKRGRGRPAGSKSGANQKVTSGKSYGGIATHSLHLPSSNR